MSQSRTRTRATTQSRALPRRQAIPRSCTSQLGTTRTHPTPDLSPEPAASYAVQMAAVPGPLPHNGGSSRATSSTEPGPSGWRSIPPMRSTSCSEPGAKGCGSPETAATAGYRFRSLPYPRGFRTTQPMIRWEWASWHSVAPLLPRRLRCTWGSPTSARSRARTTERLGTGSTSSGPAPIPAVGSSSTSSCISRPKPLTAATAPSPPLIRRQAPRSSFRFRRTAPSGSSRSILRT